MTVITQKNYSMAGLVKLTSSARIVTGSNGFERGKYYSFYDPEEMNVVPSYYQELLASATQTIHIWDPHYMENYDAEIFSKVNNENLSIYILTAFHKEQDERSLRTFADNIKNVFQRNGVKKMKVTILCCERKNPKLWHDRYLMIDEKDVFLVGASMNNQIKSEKSFGICKVIDSDDIILIKSKYNKYREKCNSTNSCRITRNIKDV